MRDLLNACAGVRGVKHDTMRPGAGTATGAQACALSGLVKTATKQLALLCVHPEAPCPGVRAAALLCRRPAFLGPSAAHSGATAGRSTRAPGWPPARVCAVARLDALQVQFSLARTLVHPRQPEWKTAAAALAASARMRAPRPTSAARTTGIPKNSVLQSAETERHACLQTHCIP
jgi:hypothetical protein